MSDTTHVKLATGQTVPVLLRPQQIDLYAPPSFNELPIPDQVRIRILTIFQHYPKISPSMLQVGIGPQIAPRDWHPVLESLILENAIERLYYTGSSPTGRSSIYTYLQARLNVSLNGLIEEVYYRNTQKPTV